MNTNGPAGDVDHETKNEVAVGQQVPENVKTSEFGCANCLFASVECMSGSRYGPSVTFGQSSCKSYVYYD